MSDDRLLKTLVSLTEWKAKDNQDEGRPARRWIDDVLMWCGMSSKEQW